MQPAGLPQNVNLNTIKEVMQPRSADEIVKWQDSYAWLAGGTWLFSTPQIATDTLIDLRSLKWPSLEVSETGLDIAATCTIAELYHFKAPADWIAAPLFQLCSRAFLASFKIWNAATVGGNICMSLPAGPMVTLTTALEARYTLLPRDGSQRQVAAIDFVTGNHEYYHGAPGWEEMMRRLGATVLHNEHRVLTRGGDSLVVAGVTDAEGGHFGPGEASRPDLAFAGAPEGTPRILLAHQPRTAFKAAPFRIDLQLSGHTHGGQIIPWMLLVRLQQPVIRGLTEVPTL